jgi:hypothetical protein
MVHSVSVRCHWPTFRAETSCQVNCVYTVTWWVWLEILIYICNNSGFFLGSIYGVIGLAYCDFSATNWCVIYLVIVLAFALLRVSRLTKLYVSV